MSEQNRSEIFNDDVYSFWERDVTDADSTSIYIYIYYINCILTSFEIEKDFFFSSLLLLYLHRQRLPLLLCPVSCDKTVRRTVYFLWYISYIRIGWPQIFGREGEGEEDICFKA